MLYRILFALLVVFVAAACGDSPRYAKSGSLAVPIVPAKPIVVADSTVGTLPQASGASPAGEYQINVPLDVPAGRAGMAPSLSLAYSSSAGRDTLGFGWSLQGATSFIRVCAAPYATRGVLERPDSFCLDQQVLVEIKKGEWRTENESFSKIVQLENTWEVWTKNGRIRTYEPVTAETNIRFWALASERDHIGNRIDYFYKHEETADHEQFVYDIERIEYTASKTQAAQRKIEFHYEPSDSPAFVRVWDAAAKTYHQRDVSALLTKIEMFGPDEVGASALAWSYELKYERSPDTDRPLLTSIEKCGGLGGCLQARTFTYSQKAPDAKNKFSTIWEHVRDDAIPREQIRVLDANGDGKDDLFVAVTLDYGKVYVSDDPDEAVVSKTIPGPDAITVDIDGDGRVEMVGTRTLSTKPLKWEKWIYRADATGKYSPWKKLPNTGALWPNDPYVTGYNILYTEIFGIRFGDVDGDGLPDLCRERPGYTLIDPDPSITAVWWCAKNLGNGSFGTWDLYAFATRIGDGLAYLADVDGDGRAEFHHCNDTLADTDGDGLLKIVATDQSDALTVGDFDGDGRDELAVKDWHAC